MDMQTTNIVKILARFPVFATFSHQEQAQLAQLAVRRSYQKGEYVAHSGDIWPYVIIIDYGEIHAMKMSPAGRSFGTLKLQAGEEFWSPTLFNGIPLPATLEVWKPSAIYFLHQEQVLPLVQKNYSSVGVIFRACTASSSEKRTYRRNCLFFSCRTASAIAARSV
jgi:CRP-like cAMP-binding protein